MPATAAQLQAYISQVNGFDKHFRHALSEMSYLIPIKKRAPVLSGKAAPVGTTGVVWRARRARVAPLGTRVNARSNGGPDVVA
jgi:hypothetical protein